MNFIRKNLANAFTLANLASGSIGILLLMEKNAYTATAVCLALSLVLDFLDGFVARAMKSNSPLGAQLDSLADMVSFGFLPGVAMYKMLEPFGNSLGNVELPFDLKYLGLLITVFSCLRLAIFNLDEEQTYYFKGLNTPSNTVLIFGLYHLSMTANISGNFNGSLAAWLSSPLFLLVLTVLSSWLLIAPVKMISLKFKSRKISDNTPKLALLPGAMLLFLGMSGVPLLIIYYIVISLLFQKQLN